MSMQLIQNKKDLIKLKRDKSKNSRGDKKKRDKYNNRDRLKRISQITKNNLNLHPKKETIKRNDSGTKTSYKKLFYY